MRPRNYAWRSQRGLNVQSGHFGRNIRQPCAPVHHRAAGLAERLEIASGRIRRDIIDHPHRRCFRLPALEAIHLPRLARALCGFSLLRPPFLKIAAEDQCRLGPIDRGQALFQPAAHRVLVHTEQVGQFGHTERPMELGEARIDPLHREALTARSQQAA